MLEKVFCSCLCLISFHCLCPYCAGGSLESYGVIPEEVLGRVAVAVRVCTVTTSILAVQLLASVCGVVLVTDHNMDVEAM